MLIKRLLIALFLLFPAKVFAADSTVAALAAASALAGSELFYCVQSSTDKKCTATQLSTFILTTPNIGVATATSINGVGLTGTGTITTTASTSIGAGQYLGVATNTAASAGNIGEYLTGTGTTGNLGNSTPTNSAQISLTAGDWDVSCRNQYTGNGTTTVNYVTASVSTTTNTLDTAGDRVNYLITNQNALFAVFTTMSSAVGPARFLVSSTTTVFCVAQAAFGVSTIAAAGTIWARRTH